MDLSRRIANLTPEQRAVLELRLLQRDASVTARVPIPRLGEREPGPLSCSQERLWFLDQLDSGSAVYNLSQALQLTGSLDRDALQRALDGLVARHAVLRTTYRAVAGAPVQIVGEARAVAMPVIPIRGEGVAERDNRARQRCREEHGRPFDLARDLMLRAALLELGEQEFWLLLTMHHIATDGWSTGVLLRELSAFYTAFAAGEDGPALPALPIQYRDFAVWQRQRLQDGVLDDHRDYWKQRLAGARTELDLPTDRPHPPLPSFKGARRSLRIEQELTAALQALSRREDVTLFMTLLAAWQTLLFRYSGQEDLIVGTPIANRGCTEIEDLIGFFVNTLPMRADLSGDPTFTGLLARVRGTALAAYAHQDFPFEQLVAKLQPERTTNRSPVCQVMFVLQNAPRAPLTLPGLAVTPVTVSGGTAKFELTLSLTERAGELQGIIEYSTDLFDAETIERLAGHFLRLLESIVAAPETRLSRLPLLTGGERRQLVLDWNRTDAAYPHDQSLHRLFAERAARTPDGIAVRYLGEALTYRELDARANRLAHALLRRGVRADARVGLCVEPSLEFVMGALAILKAGGAYVPLDPRHPPARLAQLLTDARVTLTLTTADLYARLPEAGAVLCLDRDAAHWERESDAAPLAVVGASDLAYVIYTSGSTGEPKGVAVPHRAVLRLVQGADYVQLNATDRVAQVSSLAFDAATFEIWGALLNGACLVGLDRDVLLSPERLAAALREERITTLFLTTALFNQVARLRPDAFRSLRHLLFGGEAADAQSVAAVLRHGPPERLLHVYGPTETTTFATWYLVREVPAGATTIPIGRPIANTRCYVLDGALQPVPVGIPGELYIGGPGVARGYLDRPELTAERFIPDPFTSGGTTLYRTGDRVRYLPDGNLEFLGRSDGQVKVRGFRVELGEIEAALHLHPAVAAAVVVARRDEAGEQRLTAYVVPAMEGRRANRDDRAPPPASAVVHRSPFVEELRHYLKERLPQPLVPAAFVLVDALPVTLNGKVDRRALPEPVMPALSPTSAAIAPRDPVELRLARIWERLLGVRAAGVTEDFFALGGHSLMAVRLRAQIEVEFGVALPLVTLFQFPTVAQQAEAIRRRRQPGEASSLVALQAGGSLTPLFCVYPTLGDLRRFCALARAMDREQPFYLLSLPDAYGKLPEQMSVQDTAARFIAEVRALQRHGPYRLGGFCFGGIVAYEMAQQLHSAGERVELLLLIDTNARQASQRPETAAWPSAAVAEEPAGAEEPGRAAPARPRHAEGGEPVISRLLRRAREFCELGGRERRDFLQARVRHYLGWHGGNLIHAGYRRCRRFLPRPWRIRLRDRLWRWTEFEVYLDARREYALRPYPGRLTLLRSAPTGKGDALAQFGARWQALSAVPVELHAIPGEHLTMFEDPYVRTLAATLTDCLRRAGSRHEEPHLP